MLGFLRRAPRKNTPGEPASPRLHWDLHAHLIPGVDDGVKTVADAIEAVRALQSLGYRGSVLTPHIYRSVYPNTRATLEPAFAQLQAGLVDAGIDHGLVMAAEYFGDEYLLELIEREPLLSFGGTSQPMVLVEFPYTTVPLLWADLFSALLRKGYLPVLAHIERYRFVLESPEMWLERFAQFGIKIQCNIGSLAGQYGREAFEFARRMRDTGVPAFWGTDLHRPKQIAQYIRPALTHLTELGELNPQLRISHS